MKDPGTPPPGTLSRLLEDLAHVRPVDLPRGHAPELRPGATVGRFVVERELGRGGFGVVYAALDPELGRPVAIKVIRPGSSLAARSTDWLRREAEAIGRLGHPNIVTLHDFGRTDRGAFLVLELLRGETLAARLARGPLPVPEAIHVGLQVSRALAHAHRCRVLHRDLKPSNVFLCEDGTVKVLDFGIAHLFGQEGPSTGGTPGYMAPEQWREESGDARTDLFALGVLLHEMLSGRSPVRAVVGFAAHAPPDTAEMDRAARAAGAPRRLRALAAALLQQHPEDRPRSAEAVISVLETIDETPTGRRGRRLRAAGLVLGVAAALLAAWALVRPHGAPAAIVRVAVGAVENATGDRDFDALPALVAAGLQAGAGIHAGPAPAPGPGPASAGGRRPEVTVTAGAVREGDGFRLTLRGERPGGGRFEVEERAPSAREAMAAIDRLVTRARARLADGAGAGARLQDLFTPSLAAFRAWNDGLACVAHPSDATAATDLDRCGPLFREALAGDPEFPQAHYRLAFLLSRARSTQPDPRLHLSAAVRGVPRVPPRDAALIAAWQAHLDGRDTDALSAYSRILRDDPDDLEALLLTGDLLFHSGRAEEATAFFRKVLDIDPESKWPLEHLVECYALSGNRAELRALAGRLERPAGRVQARALVRAHAWLGEGERAVAAARAAVALGVDDETLLLGALLAAGEFGEASAVARALSAAQPHGYSYYLALVSAERGRGRAREAWRLVSRPPAELVGLRAVDLAIVKASLAAGDGDTARLEAEADKIARADPASLANAAALVALRGSPERAREYAQALPPASVAARSVDALLAWRRGEVNKAVAALGALEQEAPWPEESIAPSFLLAEAAAATDPAESLAAARRYQSLWPRTPARSWAYPRSVLLAAQALERLGDRPAARAEADRLARMLRDADPDLPLLRDLRKLDARLRSQTAAPSVLVGEPR